MPRHLKLFNRLCDYHFAPEDAKVSSQRTQAYVSTSDDPYLNLSIEHYLLEKSPEDSTILFLYINKPCVVIGRNQNPWSEVNLARLARHHAQPATLHRNALTKVDLVRRRSGGGTVFHDAGNVNWTVICPSAAFTRDKHCEMVVRALRNNGIQRARVNERHDIVLDQSTERMEADHDDMHRTTYSNRGTDAVRPLKVSGSAYKLTKGRALHHATALLESPNLHNMSKFLHSPARPYIDARGVESVSSPVANIGLPPSIFVDAVSNQFKDMYCASEDEHNLQQVGEELLENRNISEGIAELKTPEWLFDKTPQFTLSIRHDDQNQDNSSSHETGTAARVPIIRFRNGKVQEARIFSSADENLVIREVSEFSDLLAGMLIRDVKDWKGLLQDSRLSLNLSHAEKMGEWLNNMLPDVSTFYHEDP